MTEVTIEPTLGFITEPCSDVESNTSTKKGGEKWMKVKTAFMIFGACFILGIIFFVVVVQGWIVGQAAPMIFVLARMLFTVGFLGSLGTYFYWFFFRRNKG
jgi:hypothetical protein